MKIMDMYSAGEMIASSRKLLLNHGVVLAENDDSISIYGKFVGLKKPEVIRLFREIGWRMFDRYRKNYKGTPSEDDGEYFLKILNLIAVSNGIKRFPAKDSSGFMLFLVIGLLYYGFCFREDSNCPQSALRWTLQEYTQAKPSVLEEADRIVREQGF